jgi:hypothetical protein
MIRVYLSGANGYGMGALAENAMSRLKRLFGGYLTALLPQTQTAEVHMRAFVRRYPSSTAQSFGVGDFHAK